jgi:glycosyltransferase involved in cell wall biosynthesis
VRVLYFADTRFPIERANGLQTLATCHALAGRGHEIALVTRPDTAHARRDPFTFYGFEPRGGLTFAAIPSRGGRLMARLQFLRGALKLARQSADAVVYTRDLGLAAFLLGLPFPLRPRLVYESHGLAPVVSAELPALLGPDHAPPSAAKLARLERRERRVWRRAGAYVTLTRALADELERRYGPRAAVFVAPDGARPVETDVAPDSPPQGLRRPIVGYAGHLYPWKGVDVFVRALSFAPHVDGLIVGGHPGEADRARIEELAGSIGVAERLEITGLVPPADVPRRLSPTTILVLPNTGSRLSERYTSPLKLFEYLWLGRPIVAADLPALREVLTGNQTALMVPPDDPEAFGRAFERLAADPLLAQRLGRAARALAPLYTWDRRAERIDDALRAAAGVS